MKPRIKWGLVTGGVVAIMNLCGGTLIAAFNNCLSVITVIIAAAIAGYFCGRQEPAPEAVKGGGIAGVIVGAINLVSQLIGGLIGGMAGLGLLAAFGSQAQTDPLSLFQGGGIALGVIALAAFLVGAVLILVGAGVGALAARLATPKVDNLIAMRGDGTPGNI
jgi:hypothetical protein